MEESENKFSDVRPFIPFLLVSMCLMCYQNHISGVIVDAPYAGTEVNSRFGSDIDLDSRRTITGLLLVTQLAICWLADSYISRTSFVYAYFSLSILSPILIVFRAMDYGGYELNRLWLIIRSIMIAELPVTLVFVTSQLKLPQSEHRMFTWVTAMISTQAIGHIIAWGFGKFVVISLKNYIINALIVSALDFIILCILLKKRQQFRSIKPQYLAVERMVKCLSLAVLRKILAKDKLGHWSVYIRGKFDEDTIETTKRFVAVAKLLVPLLLLSLISEYLKYHTSFQDKLMKDSAGIRRIKIDVIQEFTTALTGPFLRFGVYPFFKGLRIPVKELPLFTVSYAFFFLSFLCVIYLQGVMDRSQIIFPRPGYSDIRLYNSLSHAIELKSKLFHSDDSQWTTINPMSVFVAKKIKTTERRTESAQIRVNSTVFYFVLVATENQATAYVVRAKQTPIRFLGFEPVKAVLHTTNSTCYVICALATCAKFSVQIGDTKSDVGGGRHIRPFEIEAGEYTVRIYRLSFLMLEQKYEFRESSVSSLLIYQIPTADPPVGLKIFDIQQSSDLIILWILPQVIFQVVGDFILMAITIVFLYTQSPPQLWTICFSIFGSGTFVKILISSYLGDVTTLNLGLATSAYVVSFCIFVYVALKFPYKEWIIKKETREGQKKEEDLIATN